MSRWEHLRERLLLDCSPIRVIAALIAAVLGEFLLRFGLPTSGVAILTRIHRSNASGLASRRVERLLGKTSPVRSTLSNVYRDHFSAPGATPAINRFLHDPSRLLGTRILVLKPASDYEKGLIVIDYSFMFRLFASTFDVSRIAQRYHLVLEPSWVGYCDLNILSFAQFDSLIFVQSIEPRDNAFLESLGASFVRVPISGNWWVDHRVMRPLPEVTKDVDLVYVAAWARYKRHVMLFEALRRLLRQGVRISTLLVGYPSDRTRDDIFREAKAAGVHSMIELQDGIDAAGVNLALNRAKVNLLWSRREGFNRAVIEGMFAGVPCIIRKGHNFGHTYPYVNPRTGCFASEEELPQKLLWMRDRYSIFQPRAWVMENMSCQLATTVLASKVRDIAERSGEGWVTEPVIKVTSLHRMSYWDSGDESRFITDYAFLRECLRGVRSKG